jgi:hypothetical protein
MGAEPPTGETTHPTKTRRETKTGIIGALAWWIGSNDLLGGFFHPGIENVNTLVGAIQSDSRASLEQRPREYNAEGQRDWYAHQAQYRTETDGEVAEPHEVLVDATQSKPRPVPNYEESSHDDGCHATDVENLIEITAPAC